jgi:general secretion pathway protein C
MRFRSSLHRLEALAPWLLGVLIVWLCWQLAAVFWLIAAPPQPPVSRSVSLGSGTQSTTPNITGFSLFKEDRPDLAASAPTAFAVAVPLRLEGVFVSQPLARSAAVLRVNNQSRHYRVGQIIEESQLTLTSVSWDHVMLQRPDGSLARLRFNEDLAASEANAPVGTAAPLIQTPLSQGQQVDAMLDDASRQLSNNPAAYLSQMGLNATHKGYEITESVPANLRARLGLKAGDRIVSLNGQPLGQPTNDARLLDQVKQQRRAQIEVQRGEQTMTIQQSF